MPPCVLGVCPRAHTPVCRCGYRACVYPSGYRTRVGPRVDSVCVPERVLCTCVNSGGYLGGCGQSLIRFHAHHPRELPSHVEENLNSTPEPQDPLCPTISPLLTTCVLEVLSSGTFSPPPPNLPMTSSFSSFMISIRPCIGGRVSP